MPDDADLRVLLARVKRLEDAVRSRPTPANHDEAVREMVHRDDEAWRIWAEKIDAVVHEVMARYQDARRHWLNSADQAMFEEYRDYYRSVATPHGQDHPPTDSMT